jgi:hypothetical protein
LSRYNPSDEGLVKVMVKISNVLLRQLTRPAHFLFEWQLPKINPKISAWWQDTHYFVPADKAKGEMLEIYWCTLRHQNYRSLAKITTISFLIIILEIIYKLSLMWHLVMHVAVRCKKEHMSSGQQRDQRVAYIFSACFYCLFFVSLLN